MLKKIMVTATMACIAAPLFMAPPAQAASETECAIWVCLPGAFKSGSRCGAPFAAMVTRIVTYRSPLPNFAGCLKADGFIANPNLPARAQAIKLPDFTFKSRVKNHRNWRGKIKSSEHWIYTYENGRPTGGYYIRVKGRNVQTHHPISPYGGSNL